LPCFDPFLWEVGLEFVKLLEATSAKSKAAS